MKLRLDLHIHSEASPDGRMSLEEIAERARAAGLDGVAVCDHDRALTDPPDLPGLLVIPGVELSTDRGHLLGLFVTEDVPARSFAEAAEALHRQGALAVLAHPFEHARSPEQLAELAPLLDGAEVWNGRAGRKNRRANAQAAEFARRHGLRPFAGSDAHVPEEIGNGAVTVEVPERTLPAVRAALTGGAASIDGREGASLAVAKSQLTRRKKAGASPAGYMKWALFAAKCAFEDLIRGKEQRDVSYREDWKER